MYYFVSLSFNHAVRYTEVDPKSSVRRKLQRSLPAAKEQLAARGVYGRVAYAESGQWIDFAMNAAVE